MNGSDTSRRLLVTWAVLVPVLLVIAVVFNPGTFPGMIIAAAISPVVHRVARMAYAYRKVGPRTASKRMFGGG